MRLTFVIVDAGRGGHTRTAVTIGRALRSRGHDVQFVVGDRSDAELVVAADFVCVRLHEDRIGRLHALAQSLRSHESVAVHIFSRRGLTSTLRACHQLELPFYWTICGGAPPRGVPAGGRVISLSKEVAQGLLTQKLIDPAYLTVEPARIDIDLVAARINAGDAYTHELFRKEHGLTPETRIVLRISRMARAYMHGISHTAEATAALARQGHDVAFVHIGYASDGGESVGERLRQEFAELNRKAGRVVALTTAKEARNPLPYLRMATAAVGAGRTAYEAMLAGLPTLIVGVNGFAGIATHTQAANLIAYNFSGRNAARQTRETSVAQIADVLRPLLAGRSGLDSEWLGPQWVRDHLDASTAALTYEAIYALPPGPLPGRSELLRYDLLTLVERATSRVRSRLSKDWLPNSASAPT